MADNDFTSTDTLSQKQVFNALVNVNLGLLGATPDEIAGHTDGYVPDDDTLNQFDALRHRERLELARKVAWEVLSDCERSKPYDIRGSVKSDNVVTFPSATRGR